MSCQARQLAVGTAVFGGMLIATILMVVFVPVFFLVFQRFGERFFGEAGAREETPEGMPAAEPPRT